MATTEAAQPAALPQTRPWVKVIVAIIVALFILVAPTPTSLDEMIAIKSAWRGSGIAVTGHSVITHVSKCDADRRTLPQIIGADAGTADADLSYPGQTIFDGFNFAQLAVGNAKIRDTVINLSLSQVANYGRPTIQAQGFFRLLSGPYSINAMLPRILGLEPITEGTMAQQTAFTYRGVRYPDYGLLKSRYLTPELKAESCPEQLGMNRPFIEALYWNNYLRTPIHTPYFDDLRRLEAATRKAGKRFLIVLLPIDFEDLRSLNPTLARDVAQRRDEFLAQARAAGLDPLDLSTLLPATAYSDRWCGCGHLADVGRQAVAAKTVAALRTRT